jgi:large conductance mechanosensitive channel
MASSEFTNLPQAAQEKSEVEEIREDITKISKGTLQALSGFRTFILRGNVVDLAIGIVIGAAFTAVVNAVVSNVITPLIPVPGNSLAGLKWQVPYAKAGVFVDIGALINALISFIIVAAVLYFFVVKPVNALTKLYKPKELEAHETRNCPYCFQAVHIEATRCPFCTSRLKKEANHEEQEPILELPASLEALSEKLAEKIIRKATSKLEAIAEPTTAAE